MEFRVKCVKIESYGSETYHYYKIQYRAKKYGFIANLFNFWLTVKQIKEWQSVYSNKWKIRLETRLFPIDSRTLASSKDLIRQYEKEPQKFIQGELDTFRKYKETKLLYSKIKY